MAGESRGDTDEKNMKCQACRSQQGATGKLSFAEEGMNSLGKFPISDSAPKYMPKMQMFIGRQNHK